MILDQSTSCQEAIVINLNGLTSYRQNCQESNYFLSSWVILGLSVMPQFDWLYNACECLMSPTSGIYWVELGFINNCKEPQLWLVLLRYNADVASAFLWVVTLSLILKDKLFNTYNIHTLFCSRFSNLKISPSGNL